MKLKIAENLSLPVEIVTQTVAVLAKRRAGKSYLMRRLVEQLVHAQEQVVLVDPKGDQWGVRSAADGKAAGLPLVILGGERGDVPLEAGSGEVVAKLIVEERVSVVLDLSLFRKHEVATFMTGFMENLYRLKAKEIYRTPMMLVIDEADAVAPQKPQKGEERMLGAAEDIVRRGGQRGIGCVLVTQRSAVLNKNVLTQAQVLVALRTIAPQDLAAMNAWIDVHGTEEQKRTLMESLPSLPVGDAWVWSPGWPTNDGIFRRVHVLPIETYDSGASPDPAQKGKRAEPKAVAEVDLEALKRQMSATIEKAKADDPRELRKQLVDKNKEIARLVAESSKQADTKKTAICQPKVVEKPVLTEKDRQVLDTLTTRLHDLASGLTAGIDKIVEDIRVKVASAVNTASGDMITLVTRTEDDAKTLLHRVGVERALEKLDAVRPPATLPSRQAVSDWGQKFEAAARTEPRRPAAAPPRVPPSGGNGDLAPSERKLLEVLARHGEPIDRKFLAIRSGYSFAGGGFRNTLSAVSTRGYIDKSGSQIGLTATGLDLFDGQTLDAMTSDEIQGIWRGKLSPAEFRMLQVLLDAAPEGLTRQELAARANYDAAGGGFRNTLSALSVNGLIEKSGRDVRASSALFLEGR